MNGEISVCSYFLLLIFTAKLNLDLPDLLPVENQGVWCQRYSLPCDCFKCDSVKRIDLVDFSLIFSLLESSTTNISCKKTRPCLELDCVINLVGFR